MPRSCSTCRWQTVSLRCQGSVREEHRFSYILATDDPTHEISAAWGVKEQLRRVLACTTLNRTHTPSPASSALNDEIDRQLAVATHR